MQRAPHAGAAFAPRPIRGRALEVLLLPLRGRFRGVARGLRRTGQFVQPRLSAPRCGRPVLRYGWLARQGGRPPTPAEQSVPQSARPSRSGFSCAGAVGGTPMCRIGSPATASRNFWGRNFWSWLTDFRPGVDLRPQTARPSFGDGMGPGDATTRASASVITVEIGPHLVRPAISPSRTKRACVR
jgi:hypothetical protein